MNPDQDMVYLARFLLTLGATGYMLPSIVALYRWHPKTLAIILINLLLGYSGIGWVYSLLLAMSPIERGAAAPFTPAAGRRANARVEPRL